MNPASIAVVQLYACGAHMSRCLRVEYREIPWLPSYWWGCITNRLPMDVQMDAVLVGLEVIMAGLADMMSEAPN